LHLIAVAVVAEGLGSAVGLGLCDVLLLGLVLGGLEDLLLGLGGGVFDLRLGWDELDVGLGLGDVEGNLEVAGRGGVEHLGVRLDDDLAGLLLLLLGLGLVIGLLDLSGNLFVGDFWDILGGGLVDGDWLGLVVVRDRCAGGADSSVTWLLVAGGWLVARNSSDEAGGQESDDGRDEHLDGLGIEESITRV